MENKIYKLFGRSVAISPREADTLEKRFLRNYVYLQDALREATEDECFKAMLLELTSKRKRRNIIYRLHSKFTELRAKRERREQQIERI